MPLIALTSLDSVEILLVIGDKCSINLKNIYHKEKYDHSPFPLNFDTVHCPWTQNLGRWHPLGQGSREFLSTPLPPAPLCLPDKRNAICQNANKYIQHSSLQYFQLFDTCPMVKHVDMLPTFQPLFNVFIYHIGSNFLEDIYFSLFSQTLLHCKIFIMQKFWKFCDPPPPSKKTLTSLSIRNQWLKLAFKPAKCIIIIRQVWWS